MKDIKPNQLQLGAEVIVGVRGGIVGLKECEDTGLPVVTLVYGDLAMILDVTMDPAVDLTYTLAADGPVADGDVWETVNDDGSKARWVAFRSEDYDYELRLTCGYSTIDPTGFLMLHGPARRIIKGEVDS